MNPNLLSTKFLFAVLIVVLGFVLVLMRQLTAQVWVTFALGVGSVYVIGNVADKYVTQSSVQEEPAGTKNTEST